MGTGVRLLHALCLTVWKQFLWETTQTTHAASLYTTQQTTAEWVLISSQKEQKYTHTHTHTHKHSQNHILYSDTGTICIILAVDQNWFKLHLYNEYGFKVQTLSFNLRVFPSKLEERLRNYSSLIYTPPPLFQGTISN